MNKLILYERPVEVIVARGWVILSTCTTLASAWLMYSTGALEGHFTNFGPSIMLALSYGLFAIFAVAIWKRQTTALWIMAVLTTVLTSTVGLGLFNAFLSDFHNH